MALASVKRSCCAVAARHCNQPVCKISKQTTGSPARATLPPPAPQRATLEQQTNIKKTLFVARAAATLICLGERDQQTHGSLRCDRDIGLHTLLDTFLI